MNRDYEAAFDDSLQVSSSCDNFDWRIIDDDSAQRAARRLQYSIVHDGDLHILFHCCDPAVDADAVESMSTVELRQCFSNQEVVLADRTGSNRIPIDGLLLRTSRRSGR